MSFKELLAPYQDRLEVPSPEEVAARAELHERFNVTDDYMAVYLSGALSLDLSGDIGAPSADAELPFWTTDISMLGKAEDPAIEDMPETLASVFYYLGDDSGGGFIFQISRGKWRGCLASIADSYIESFEYGEVDVPDAPITTDEAADAYLAGLRQSILSIRDLNLQEFFELRLRHARR